MCIIRPPRHLLSSSLIEISSTHSEQLICAFDPLPFGERAVFHRIKICYYQLICPRYTAFGIFHSNSYVCILVLRHSYHP